MRIAIIGAGISGLYSSLKLSKKNYEVTVFERKNKIGQETCSGLFSSKIFDFFPESKNLIKNKIDYTIISFPKKTIRVDFKNPFFVMSHAELDKMAAELAEKSGVKIILNKEIKKTPQGFDRIIGSDGPNSFNKKNLGVKKNKYRLGILGFSKNKQKNSNNFVETWPIKKGFIWKIPRGENTEYGIMAPQKYAKNNFNQFLKNKNIVLQDIKAKLIPQYFHIPKNKSITLLGDAAGLTKPWSGGGVIWQLTLADILIDTFPDFLKYEKRAKKTFRKELFISKNLVNIVYFLGFNLPWFLPKNNKINSDFFCENKS